MRTTLDIDPKLIEEAGKITGEKTASKAVNKALAEFVRSERAKELVAGLGTWELDLDDWEEFRHMERL